MSVDYIPQPDTLMLAWADKFSEKITATPGAYGLMASDASAIAAAVNLFDAALQRVLDPATKTKSTVAAKNAKKAAMLVTLRQYAQTIKRNLGVSNEAKIDLGLHINDVGPSPIPAPTTFPVLAVDSDAPFVQRVEFHDSTTPERKAKPAGVTGMMLAVAVVAAGATPPAPPPPNEVPVRGIVTRQPHRVTFSAGDRGKVAFYYGCWVTGAALTGPWSAVAQLSIAG
jgi:hypothetical protein